MKSISARRTAAATIIAVACIAIPATASAMPYSPPPTTRSEAAQSGTDGKTNDSVQPQTGSKINAGFPSADFRGGDNPADHPGTSRAPQYDGPTTIEVVRPERTIVRDVDEALPIALAGTALLLVLATRGITLVRARLVPRPGRSN